MGVIFDGRTIKRFSVYDDNKIYYYYLNDDGICWRSDDSDMSIIEITYDDYMDALKFALDNHKLKPLNFTPLDLDAIACVEISSYSLYRLMPLDYDTKMNKFIFYLLNQYEYFTYCDVVYLLYKLDLLFNEGVRK